MRQIQLPVNDRSVPTFSHVERFISLVDDPAAGIFYVHCRGGTGRTQTLAACWRVAHGESAETAIQKALTSRIRWTLDFPFNVSLSVIFSMNSKQREFVRAFEKEFRRKTRNLNLPNRSFPKEIAHGRHPSGGTTR